MLIRLTGCLRYTFRSERYEQGFDYDLGESKARELLSKVDEYERPYFSIALTPRPPLEEITEETTDPTNDAIKIKRKRGRPRKNPLIKTSGDTSPLPDIDTEPDMPTAGTEAGDLGDVEV
jgi:hypothetical protein